MAATTPKRMGRPPVFRRRASLVGRMEREEMVALQRRAQAAGCSTSARARATPLAALRRDPARED